MRKIKLISLFSGIGAFEEALKRHGVDFETVVTSEIDKEAVVAYAAAHCGLTPEMIEGYNFPQREQMAAQLERINLGFDVKTGKAYDWHKVARKKAKEIEKYWLAAKLALNVGDITQESLTESIMNRGRLGEVDLLTYGFP